MPCLTLSDLIAIESFTLALLAFSTPVFLPEVRTVLKLDPPQPISAFAFKVYKLSALALFLMAIFLVIWFVLCYTKIQTTRAAEPPLPEGPIREVGTAEVDGVRFTLYTFLQGYYWKYDKVEVAFNGRTITDEEMIGYLARLKETISLGDAVICIGAASQDIEKGKTESFEEERASTRATQMALWIGPAVSQANQLRAANPPVEIYRLNLGHYGDGPDQDEQRMVIFVRVKRTDPNVSLNELLSPANLGELKKKLKEKKFPFSFDSYSLFDLTKHT